MAVCLLGAAAGAVAGLEVGSCNAAAQNPRHRCACIAALGSWLLTAVCHPLSSCPHVRCPHSLNRTSRSGSNTWRLGSSRGRVNR